MKKIVFIALLILSITSMSVGAKEYIDCKISNNNVVSIEKKTGGAKKKISLMVYRSGRSYDDLETNPDSVVACEQEITDNDGNVHFEFKLDLESGFYTAELTDEDSEVCSSYEFFFANPIESAKYLDKLNSCNDGNEVYSLLYGQEKGWEKLGFFAPTDESFDEKKTSDILSNILAEGDFESVPEAVDAFKEAVTIEMLNENKTVSIEEFIKFLKLEDKAYFSDYSDKSLSNDFRKDIIDSVKGKSIKNREELDKTIIEQLILKTVTYADGYGKIKDIIKKYSTILNIKADDYSNIAYQKVIGKSYKTLNDLKSALKDADSKKDKDNSETRGGGGGGSSSTGTKINPVSMTKVDVGDIVPIEKVYFDDIENYAWAKEAINYLSEQDIINGKAERVFEPSLNITREEFTAIIVRAFKLNLDADVEIPEFDDVEENAWYEQIIRIAYSKGIVSGKNDSTFGVGENITRQDMAVILSRVLSLSDVPDEGSFIDDIEINEYAKKAVYQMRSNGIISGYEDNSFKPKNNSTRSEAAVMVYRALNKKG